MRSGKSRLEGQLLKPCSFFSRGTTMHQSTKNTLIAYQQYLEAKRKMDIAEKRFQELEETCFPGDEEDYMRMRDMIDSIYRPTFEEKIR